MECGGNFTPHKEFGLYQSLKDVVVIEPKIDEFEGLDVDAKEKALKRREVKDNKKVENQEIAQNKAEKMNWKEKKGKRRL